MAKFLTILGILCAAIGAAPALAAGPQCSSDAFSDDVCVGSSAYYCSDSGKCLKVKVLSIDYDGGFPNFFQSMMITAQTKDNKVVQGRDNSYGSIHKKLSTCQYSCGQN